MFVQPTCIISGIGCGGGGVDDSCCVVRGGGVNPLAFVLGHFLFLLLALF